MQLVNLNPCQMLFSVTHAYLSKEVLYILLLMSLHFCFSLYLWCSGLGVFCITILTLTHKMQTVEITAKYLSIPSSPGLLTNTLKGSDFHTKTFSNFGRRFIMNRGTSFTGCFPYNLHADMLTNGAHGTPYLYSAAPQPHTFPDLSKELYLSDTVPISAA